MRKICARQKDLEKLEMNMQKHFNKILINFGENLNKT